MKIIVTIIPANLVENLLFCTNQKQESNSQQVRDLVTRNTPSFCLYQVARYFKICRIQQTYIKGFSYMFF